MPWNETNAMRERIRFIHEWEMGDLTMAGACRKYGVGRPTGYKWIQRYLEFEGDLATLVDLPRTPHQHPWATDAQMVDLIIRARRQLPTWGPRSLRERLRRAYPQPAALDRLVSPTAGGDRSGPEHSRARRHLLDCHARSREPVRVDHSTARSRTRPVTRPGVLRTARSSAATPAGSAPA
ncbi:MAG: helix-turn-helix domain-containing protein [Planctomycetes bacterium]|nr:helix-turn-helix domain-containing protein [Planctomycetota bacterium]